MSDERTIDKLLELIKALDERLREIEQRIEQEDDYRAEQKERYSS